MGQNIIFTTFIIHAFHNFIFSRYKVSWFQQFRSVFWRSWLTNNRDSTVFKMRFFQSIVSILHFWTVFYEITKEYFASRVAVLRSLFDFRMQLFRVLLPYGQEIGFFAVNIMLSKIPLRRIKNETKVGWISESFSMIFEKSYQKPWAVKFGKDFTFLY